MSESNDIPKISGYVSVKEAAQILNTSDKMVYFYIESKRLEAVRAGSMLLVPVDKLEDFKQNAVGRPRTRTPEWRIFAKDNALVALSMHVQIRVDMQEQLIKKLNSFRQKKLHSFPGTMARYIIEYEDSGDIVEVLFIWKKNSKSDDEELRRLLEAFQQELNDVLDWSTVKYRHG